MTFVLVKYGFLSQGVKDILLYSLLKLEKYTDVFTNFAVNIIVFFLSLDPFIMRFFIVDGINFFQIGSHLYT